MPRGDQLGRQWRLLHLLGRPQGLAVQEAARELGRTVRTVWRDLEVLQATGFPIYDERDGHHGRWKVDPAVPGRLPVPLSLAEIVALLATRDLADLDGASPFSPALESAFGKLRALLDPRLVERIERMQASVGARTVGAKLLTGVPEQRARIERALAERRTLQIQYYSLSRDTETERRVDPYHVTLFNGGLYLVGYCHSRRDVRIFAVERVRAARLLGATFTVPADFDPEAYFREAWGIVRGGLVAAVRAVFSPASAPHIRGGARGEGGVRRRPRPVLALSRLRPVDARRERDNVRPRPLPDRPVRRRSSEGA